MTSRLPVWFLAGLLTVGGLSASAPVEAQSLPSWAESSGGSTDFAESPSWSSSPPDFPDDPGEDHDPPAFPNAPAPVPLDGLIWLALAGAGYAVHRLRAARHGEPPATSDG